MAIAIVAACSSLSTATALAQARVDVSGLESGTTYERFIVKYRDGSPEAMSAASRERALSTAAARSTRGTAVGLSQLRRTALGADVVVTRNRLDRVEAEGLMRQIAAHPNVEYVEVDRLNYPTLTPNDPNYSQQWGYSGTYGIRANVAWDVTQGAGSVVAVLDTGITSHSDLNANVLPGYDFVTDITMANDGNGRDANASDPGDWVAANSCGYAHAARNSSWHGTHVAGTIAAVTNNGKGVAGVAPAAKILPVRVLGKCGGYTSDIADGIVWASGGTVAGVPANANPAEVINMSLGGTAACGATYQNAINSAVSRGTTVVVSAGNSNADASTATPANCNNVIAVAATTSAGVRSSFSNHGSLVDIAAPGSDILSTLNSGTTAPGTESYATYQGTSMAAPHVSGVVALMQAASTTPKTPAQIEAILKSTATPFASIQSPAIGPGIVNARLAVDTVHPPVVPPVLPSVVALVKGVPVTGILAPAGDERLFTFNVPAGATNLTFKLSGGTGDADMYVKFGDWPTTTSFDCRPYQSGNNETCSFATPQPGTYLVKVRAYSAFSGASLVADYVLPVTSTTLNKGVPVTGLSAAAGTERKYTFAVPAGASNLTFKLSGGTGDADMYVKFGSAPTTTIYDCRPYLGGNNETCTFAAPQAGTYHVMVRAYSAFSGASLVADYAAAPSAVTYSNATRYNILDLTTIESPIVVSGRSGNASASTPVTVNIIHTYQGDLKVDLVAPNGTLYNLHNRTGYSTDNVQKTVTLNLSAHPLNGTWKLRVYDGAGGDTGYLQNWSIRF
ncbi:S8 family serine peptidase [Lysobacter sp. MMG2]|uniref:S8 family serine peptidase n=1 Tax=Lysobacter sp. MMG2 TaxID=2801338 RepID=UPI001C23F595|nr:S8 family serine peptidase [Lysobacter sp. MMG2]